jgi:hypothetical protein
MRSDELMFTLTDGQMSGGIFCVINREITIFGPKNTKYAKITMRNQKKKECSYDKNSRDKKR